MTHRSIARCLVHVRSAMTSPTKLLHPEVANYIQCHHLRNQFLWMKRRKNLILDIWQINSSPFTSRQSGCLFNPFDYCYELFLHGGSERIRTNSLPYVGVKMKSEKNCNNCETIKTWNPFFPFTPSTGRSCQELSEAAKKGEKRMKIWDGSIKEWESKHPTQSLSHRCARRSRKEQTDEHERS